MIILQAPLPLIQTVTILPNPEFNDSEAGRSTVQVLQAMDGTLYSYVKSNTRAKLNYTLNVTRMKALELRAFVSAYYRAGIQLTNHKGEVWNVRFTSNPFEFSGDSRATGQPGNEKMSITLEFEGTKV